MLRSRRVPLLPRRVPDSLCLPLLTALAAAMGGVASAQGPKVEAAKFYPPGSFDPWFTGHDVAPFEDWALC